MTRRTRQHPSADSKVWTNPPGWVIFVTGRDFRGDGGHEGNPAVPNLPPSSEDQVTEHLPWEHLTSPPRPDRRILMYGLAAGLLAAVLGVVVVRQLDRPSQAELTPVTPAPAAATPGEAETAPPSPESVVSTAALAAPTAPGTPTEYSEADLVAVNTEDLHRKVAGAAEWMVLEFFTLDPADPWLDRVQTASGLRLPPGAVPGAPDGQAVSYVEWTRARSVEQIAEDTFLASVLIRRLVAADGETYRRLPTEWVELRLRLEPDGVVRAASLPEITTPAAITLIPLPEEDVGWITDQAGLGWPSSSGDQGSQGPG